MNLDGKKILFLSANFFGYEKAITKRLELLGAKVDFYNERPSDSLFTKGIIRVKSSIYQKKIDRYYDKILQKTESKSYDFFLLIKGESIPIHFLERFRARTSETKMIYYSYDAALEYPKFLKLYPYFDRNFTFEPRDALQYKLHFRPLFYIDEYKNSEKKNKAKYDIVFIGSAHTDRYLIGEKVRELSTKLFLKTYFYYFAPGKLTFILKKIFDKNLKQFNFKKLSFNKLSHAEIANIYKDSFAVLDINKPYQSGLTMRTFEALASEKKLLTTNSDIVNYPFFSSENIHILDRQHLELIPDFFQTSFKKINPEIVQKMSLDSWIECLFFDHQDDFWQGSHGTFNK